MPNDLIVLDDFDEELRFETIDRNCFQITARHKGNMLIIQPTMKDAKKIRDWLTSLISESQE